MWEGRDPATHFAEIFPLLGSNYEFTSPCTSNHNCIAYAAGDKTNWWPDDGTRYKDYYTRSGTRLVCGDSFEACCEKIKAFAASDLDRVIGESLCDDPRWYFENSTIE